MRTQTYLCQANKKRMNLPTPTHVTTERVCDGYLLTLEKGSKSIKVTVPTSDIIEWTDSEGRTFGMDDCDNVITDPGKRPAVYPVHDWIEDFLSNSDWLAFAATLPGCEKLKPALNLRQLNRHARLQATKGNTQQIPHHVRNKAVKPSWWAFDWNGKWIMVDGAKVELTDEELADFVARNFAFAGKDENGHYLEAFTRKSGPAPRLYPEILQIAQSFSEDVWWGFSKELAAQLQAA